MYVSRETYHSDERGRFFLFVSFTFSLSSRLRVYCLSAQDIPCVISREAQINILALKTQERTLYIALRFHDYSCRVKRWLRLWHGKHMTRTSGCQSVVPISFSSLVGSINHVLHAESAAHRSRSTRAERECDKDVGREHANRGHQMQVGMLIKESGGRPGTCPKSERDGQAH